MKKTDHPLRRVLSSTEGKWYLLLPGMALLLLATIVGLLVPLQIGRLISAGSHIGMSTLLPVIGLVILQTTVGAIGRYSLQGYGASLANRLRIRAVDRILHATIDAGRHRGAAAMSSHIVSDVELIRELMTSGVPELVTGVATVIGAIVILIVISWQLTLTLFGVLLALALLVSVASSINRSNYEALQATQATVIDDMTRVFNERPLIKAETAERRMKAYLAQRLNHFMRSTLRVARTDAIIDPIMTTLVMTSFLVIFMFGGLLVAWGSLKIGDMITFLLILFEVVTPITSFGSALNTIQKAQGAAKEIGELLALPIEQTGNESLPLPFTSLAFHDVSYTYSETDAPALQKVNFEVEQGTTVALVGPSGGGKSTIVSLIERLFSPTQGVITYNNVNLDTLQLDQLRKNIGYVSQQVAVIPGTIRDNLLLGTDNDIPEERLKRAIEEADAGFIFELPDGLATELEERGRNLSGGQLQRLMIARAFLRDPPILLLDEATSGLDADAESQIRELLQDLSGGRTVVTIAHHLATVQAADKLIFVDHGQITGQGTHAQLYQTHEQYHRFVDEQMLN